MTFYLGLYVQYLQVQTGGVDAETGKNHDFLSGALCSGRCRQAAWMKRPEKTMTFYPGLFVFAGADRRRGRRDRKKP
jgi:hypothetical protein